MMLTLLLVFLRDGTKNAQDILFSTHSLLILCTENELGQTLNPRLAAPQQLRSQRHAKDACCQREL